MRNKNNISMIRKTLYGIMMAGIFLSAFVAGNLPSAYAQEGNVTPTVHPRIQGTPTPENSDALTPGAMKNLNPQATYPVTDTFRFPLDGRWAVTLDFGAYNQPRFAGKHLGEDVIAAANTPLYAVANGLVKANAPHRDYMNVVIIEHTLPDGSQVTSVYGHMKSDGIIPVGTIVYKGQLIGYLDTAASFSANGYIQHEHFGIRKGGYSSTWVYYGYEYGSETISNWVDPSDFILSHQGGSSLCPSPSNGIPRDTNILNNNQVTFTWTPPVCDGLDYYTFRVSNHADIDNQPWIIDQGVDKNASNISLNIPSQYNGQTLYWAIWPHNGAGYGSKGGVWSFKIDTSTPPTPPPLPTGNWSVQYFRNKELTDQCNTTSFDRTFIFQDWGDGAPASGCNTDNWGARFTRQVYFQGGNYTFAVEADDWGRIYVDDILYVDKWNGATQHYEGHSVSTGNHTVRVEFADTMGSAKISGWWWGPGFDVPHDTQDTSQWHANYWINSTQWWDAFASKNEGYGVLNHDWGNGSPGWDMPSDGFSTKFRRIVNFDCGTYRFTLDHDDGAKFSIDDVLKLDRWSGAIGSTYIDLPILQGPHILQIDHYENGGAAHLKFDWQKLSGCQPSAPALSSPANIAVLPWDTNLSLSWNPSSGATQYFAVLQGGPGVDISSGWISTTQWDIGGLWPGVYTWSVTSRNDYGSSSPSGTRSFTIQDPPVQPVPSANFDASPLSGNAPLIATMHIVDVSNITSCLWDYGDGQTGTSCASTHDHTYNAAGTYTVSLTVNGPGGSDSMTRTDYITVTTSSSYTKQFQVSQGSDDAGMYYLCDSAIDFNEVYFGKCTSGTSITSGFRFANVTIPQGAQVISASIKFTVDGTYNNDISVTFHGEASGNAQTFSAGSLPVSRTLTTASANWSIPASDVWQSGQTCNSPDLKNIVQEIVNRSDWNGGNALAIIAKDGTAAGAPSNHRRVFAYERDGAVSSAQLVVTYTSSEPPLGDDSYEENDMLDTAYDLSYYSQTWLSNISGYGIQSDDDWYYIYVTPGYEKVLIDLRFTHSLGDIDLDLYDSFGNLLTSSASADDNEYINYTVPAGGGYYYIKVYYENQGNQYDLWWNNTVPVLTTFSAGTYDGWVLESGEYTNVGGGLNATTATFNLGDNAVRKQFRGILHFNTAGLPDNAVITKATLKMMKAGGGGNTSTLGSLLVDMTKPSFGTATLAISDFQAAAGKPNIFNPFAISGNWYIATLKSSGFTYVNRTGTTQFRLRFTYDDDNDSVADYLLFYSGNATNAATRPQLIIEYHAP